MLIKHVYKSVLSVWKLFYKTVQFPFRLPVVRNGGTEISVRPAGSHTAAMTDSDANATHSLCLQTDRAQPLLCGVGTEKRESDREEGEGEKRNRARETNT